ncbi:MAG: hypothetical protein NTU53_21855 [Planctomycetota bacterium]|nr:hypothetical protein [Planctomycetota bacterium]
MKNVAQLCLDFTSLFEAEVLVTLMLHRWQHPYADDKDFANELLEDAAQLLRMAVNGEGSPPGIPAESLSLIAAIWYAEQQKLTSESPEAEKRQAWLAAVRRSLPSCFCDPGDLVS